MEDDYREMMELKVRAEAADVAKSRVYSNRVLKGRTCGNFTILIERNRNEEKDRYRDLSYESIYLRQKDGNRTERSDRGRSPYDLPYTTHC